MKLLQATFIVVLVFFSMVFGGMNKKTLRDKIEWIQQDVREKGENDENPSNSIHFAAGIIRVGRFPEVRNPLPSPKGWTIQRNPQGKKEPERGNEAMSNENFQVQTPTIPFFRSLQVKP
ncbi:unnamed protein product [Orchesella dallaii]|uniref:Uncharacterized protein n=1 Tax=Orchesella dallaii TaxID=48710 RepID=A0ABP1S5T6_9HEXA